MCDNYSAKVPTGKMHPDIFTLITVIRNAGLTKKPDWKAIAVENSIVSAGAVQKRYQRMNNLFDEPVKPAVPAKRKADDMDEDEDEPEEPAPTPKKKTKKVVVKAEPEDEAPDSTAD
ncbi:MAG: hypothetical protein Q9168_007527 [Polycauliona sp. 1 TL-2023]